MREDVTDAMEYRVRRGAYLACIVGWIGCVGAFFALPNGPRDSDYVLAGLGAAALLPAFARSIRALAGPAVWRVDVSGLTAGGAPVPWEQIDDISGGRAVLGVPVALAVCDATGGFVIPAFGRPSIAELERIVARHVERTHATCHSATPDGEFRRYSSVPPELAEIVKPYAAAGTAERCSLFVGPRFRKSGVAPILFWALIGLGIIAAIGLIADARETDRSLGAGIVAVSVAAGVVGGRWLIRRARRGPPQWLLVHPGGIAMFGGLTGELEWSEVTAVTAAGGVVASVATSSDPDRWAGRRLDVHAGRDDVVRIPDWFDAPFAVVERTVRESREAYAASR
ncbi:MAG: hypothetical protein HMLKMBBP_03796 [Planctomycetes bacterium]|nr:hypothetical protein [Planctomycetota bacterium]